MRSALLLLGGIALLAAGIAVFAFGVPGAIVLGPVLIVAGVLVKCAGFLLGDDPHGAPQPEGGRTVTTLGGRSVERPRAGIPGRTSAIRHRSAPGTGHAREHRRAS